MHKPFAIDAQNILTWLYQPASLNLSNSFLMVSTFNDWIWNELKHIKGHLYWNICGSVQIMKCFNFTQFLSDWRHAMCCLVRYSASSLWTVEDCYDYEMTLTLPGMTFITNSSMMTPLHFRTHCVKSQHLTIVIHVNTQCITNKLIQFPLWIEYIVGI